MTYVFIGTVSDLVKTISSLELLSDFYFLFGSPNQLGEELLPMVSAILNDVSSAASSCALALQGIHALCKAEVIDIRTTFKVLGQRLREEQRPVVVKEICKLMALVPELHVEAKMYEVNLF